MPLAAILRAGEAERTRFGTKIEARGNNLVPPDTTLSNFFPLCLV
jgi:hypothetical protein